MDTNPESRPAVRIMIAASHLDTERARLSNSDDTVKAKSVCHYQVDNLSAGTEYSGGTPLLAYLECYPPQALAPALLDALSKVVAHAEVYVVTDVEAFITTMNRGTAGRQSNGYRRSDKKPIADAATWRAIDEVIVSKHLAVSGGRPRGEEEENAFQAMKRWASEVAMNIGVGRLAHWETR